MERTRTGRCLEDGLTLAAEHTGSHVRSELAIAVEEFTGFLLGCPGLQAGEKSDSCGAGQGKVIRRLGGSACSCPWW